MQQGTERDKSA